MYLTEKTITPERVVPEIVERPRCNICDEKADRVVNLELFVSRNEDNNNMVHICKDCLIKALVLLIPLKEPS